jgi:putative (di)nucleoside polyphosphate hydrolase
MTAGAQRPRRAADYRRGVGIMLLNRKNQVFVAQRINFTTDAWQMPQGGVDKGETPRQAALRELEEEIGTDKAEFLAESKRWFFYDVPPDLAREVWRGRYRGQRQKWFALRFTGTDPDINLATKHPEFDAWKWIAPEDLPRLIVPFKRQLYRELLKEFSAVLKG